jgi:hypothetical protein
VGLAAFGAWMTASGSGSPNNLTGPRHGLPSHAGPEPPGLRRETSTIVADAAGGGEPNPSGPSGTAYPTPSVAYGPMPASQGVVSTGSAGLTQTITVLVP